MPAPDDDPGVGPVVALTYRATVDVPARFRKSKAVGAVFGLTCSKGLADARSQWTRARASQMRDRSGRAPVIEVGAVGMGDFITGRNLRDLIEP